MAGVQLPTLPASPSAVHSVCWGQSCGLPGAAAGLSKGREARVSEDSQGSGRRGMSAACPGSPTRQARDLSPGQMAVELQAGGPHRGSQPGAEVMLSHIPERSHGAEDSHCGAGTDQLGMDKQQARAGQAGG